ncbi:MAG: TIGR01841 family phasin [Caulobacteraceae bacterium]
MADAAPETVNADPVAEAAFKTHAERSLNAARDFSAISTGNFEAAAASMTAVAKGAEEISAQALSWSKKILEDQLAAAKRLAAAKSLQEVIELQTAFARTAFEGYASEATKMGETFAAAVREWALPIRERAAEIAQGAGAAR